VLKIDYVSLRSDANNSSDKGQEKEKSRSWAPKESTCETEHFLVLCSLFEILQVDPCFSSYFLIIWTEILSVASRAS
jgi:hypothetical protein